MLDLRQLIPVDAIQGKTSGLASYYAQVGDYVGGVTGTVIGAVTLLVVFLAWRGDAYKGHREKIFQCAFELLQAHDQISRGVKCLEEKYDMDPFGGIIREFYDVYSLHSKLKGDGLSLLLHERIGISYIYVYYGTHSEALSLSTAHYGEKAAKLFHNAVSTKRANKDKSGHRKGYLAGHQQELSHYFRNLFTLYRYIKESRLDPADKRLLARISRSRISNYEQALLTLNVISPLGKEWADLGLVKEFEPISNVPRHFFTFDQEEFSLEQFFPYVHYEWKTYYPVQRGGLSSFVVAGRSLLKRLPGISRLSILFRRLLSR